MLVLTRQCDHIIKIGNDIFIIVRHACAPIPSIKIVTPPALPIHQKEILPCVIDNLSTH